MLIHLVRHGQTVTSGISYAGRSDVALTPEGARQAERIADALAHRPIGLILTSPLSRAKATAAPLAARLGLEPVVVPELQEIDFGAFEGRAKTAQGLTLRKTHARTPIPGGESLMDVWARAGRVLERVDTTTEAAIFGHFWINRMIFGRVMALNFDAACASRDHRPETGAFATISFAAAGCAPA